MTATTLSTRTADRDAATVTAAAAALIADGWTVEAAYAHAEGTCDRAICCGWGWND